jgi:tetratricopeptide (TPR) repeat protein
MDRRLGPLCVAVLVALSALPSRAQSEQGAPEQADKMPGAGDGPAAKIDHSRNVDFLFQALKAAPDAATAREIENRIWALWLSSGSDTADLLMTRARTAIEQKDTDLAIRLLDAVVDLKPDYVEGWNRRATLYFEKREYSRAMSDIARVLALEPRHFGALTGLGMILEDVGDDRQALQVFRRALEVDPHLDKVPDLIKTLSEKVEGRDI